ncbi:MAG TPA: MgtC/SapB family protein [Thermomicrobiaceae bacterium]|nr:MgtC/SapB family protein [Thermomicrobiaceae bacterium]
MSETDALVRVALALLYGAAIGLERELNEKPAGLRTYMLVAEGAALFMIASILLGQEFNTSQSTPIDVSRIGSTIVTGVGFLGAGMILQSRQRVYGLTTAAGIWVAAAVGMLVGAGFLLISLAGTVLAVITLVLPRLIEQRLGTWYAGHVPTEPPDVDEPTA